VFVCSWGIEKSSILRSPVTRLSLFTLRWQRNLWWFLLLLMNLPFFWPCNLRSRNFASPLFCPYHQQINHKTNMHASMVFLGHKYRTSIIRTPLKSVQFVEVYWSTLMQHMPKCSNRTYTSWQNTLIEQSSLLSGKFGSNNWSSVNQGPIVMCNMSFAIGV